MKKTLLAAAIAAALAFSLDASAQSYINSRFGVVGGVTSTTTKIKEVDAKSISMYHVGVMSEIPLGGGFALQPGLLYQVKGMSLDKWKDSSGEEITGSFETKVGYLEVPVQFQWGPDLLVFRPYGFIEPFFGYRLTDSNKGDEAKTLSSELRKVEYGMSVGAGIEIMKLQVSAKYFWNFGDVYKSDVNETATTIKGLKDGNNFNGFAISVGIFF